MSLLEKLRSLFGGADHHDDPTDEQQTKREEADRALDAMSRRR